MELHLINLSFFITDSVFLHEALFPVFLAKTIYPGSLELGHLPQPFLRISVKFPWLGKGKKMTGKGSGQSWEQKVSPSYAPDFPVLPVITVTANPDLSSLSNTFYLFNLWDLVIPAAPCKAQKHHSNLRSFSSKEVYGGSEKCTLTSLVNKILSSNLETRIDCELNR